MLQYNVGVLNGLAFACWTAKREVFCSMDTPLCLSDHKSVPRASTKPGIYLKWGREGRANGCRYFGIKKKWKKSNDTGTGKKTGKHHDMEKSKGKSIGHQRAVWVGTKERKNNLIWCCNIMSD